MKYLGNAFSLNMLVSLPASVQVREVSPETAAIRVLDSVSVVGHADTAAVFASVLGCAVPTNRVTVVLHPGDELLVGQYRGPRLEEGATTLPPGATIQWLLVTV